MCQFNEYQSARNSSLINNTSDTELPALSNTLFYQTYKVFCSTDNIVYINKGDCRFCECMRCIDFDENHDHGVCGVCGIAFYIPQGNPFYTKQGDFLVCDLDKHQEELPLPPRGDDTQNPRLNKALRKAQCEQTYHGEKGNASRQLGPGQNDTTTGLQQYDATASTSNDGEWDPPPTPITALFGEIFNVDTPPSTPGQRNSSRKRKRKRFGTTKKESPAKQSTSSKESMVGKQQEGQKGRVQHQSKGECSPELIATTTTLSESSDEEESLSALCSALQPIPSSQQRICLSQTTSKWQQHTDDSSSSSP